MESVYAFLMKNKPFYFASIDCGRPRMRPFGFVALYDKRLYFGIGKHKDAYRQVSINPEVEICVTSPEGEWIRISGDAVLDDNPEVEAMAFAEIPMLKEMYNQRTGLEIGFIYLENLVAEFRDITGRAARTVRA